MDTIKDIFEIVLSWQAVTIYSILILRNNISAIVSRIVSSNDSEIELGAIKVKLGEIVNDSDIFLNQLNDINYILADSRRLELEITLNKFPHSFDEKQQEEMLKHIHALKNISNAKNN